MERRQRIAEELLSTERTYVELLLVLQRMFLDPLKKDDSPISSKTAAIIFSNLEDIAKLNKEVLLPLHPPPPLLLLPPPPLVAAVIVVVVVSTSDVEMGSIWRSRRTNVKVKPPPFEFRD